VDGRLVADVPVPGGLQEVGVVLSQAGGKGGFRNLRSPEWQETVATGVGVLQHGRFPPAITVSIA